MRALVERKAEDLTALLQELRAVLTARSELADELGAAVCHLIEGTGGQARWIDARAATTAPTSKASKPGPVKTPASSSSRRSASSSSS